MKYFYLYFKYSESKLKAANPVPTDPVILLTVFKAPVIVFFNKLPAPLTTPIPPTI